MGLVLRTDESQCEISRIVACDISRAKRSELSFSGGTSILCGLIATTGVHEFIMDEVDDDGWVESMLLTLVDEGVDGLESECSNTVARSSSPASP